MPGFTPPGVDEVEQDQPKFTPPAPDDVDVTANIVETPYEKYKLAVARGATPENYAELPSLPPGPSARNPDWDAARELSLPALGQKAMKGAGEMIEEVAAPAFTRLKQATAGDIPVRPDQRGKGFAALDLSPEQPGKPMLDLQRFQLSPEEMAAATPTEKVVGGIARGITDTLEGFTTPGNVATLPFAEAKPVQAFFASQMAAGIPKAMEAITDAKTPDEAARAWTSLTANVGLGGLLAHGLLKEGVPNASKVKTPAEVHGDVPAQPGQGEGQVPIQEGGQGVQPPRPAQAQVSLSDEHAKVLAEHMNEVDHTFGQLREGAVMKADHDTGQVVVDPKQFAKWYDEDLKGLSPKQKAAAVKSAFEHEDIHLKTDPEDAEPFWNSLSPFEQWVLKRQYLKGQDAAKYTPQQFGFEAIRNRMERAMGLTRSDFVGMALREKWTAQGLDHLANVVDKIRRLKDSELDAHQKAILDKVQDNIMAARNAVASGGTTEDENQPFMGRRNTEKEGEGTPDMFGAMPKKGFEGEVYNRDISDFVPTTRDLIKHEQQFLLSPEADELSAAEKQKHSDHLKALMDQIEKETGKPYSVQAPEMTRRADGTPEDDLNSPLPPLHEGERVVLVRRPDGSVYRASYAGKQYDVGAGGKAMIDKYGSTKVDSVGRVDERGQWSHGILKPGEKIIKGFSPYAAVERSGGPEMTRKDDRPDLSEFSDYMNDFWNKEIGTEHIYTDLAELMKDDADAIKDKAKNIVPSGNFTANFAISPADILDSIKGRTHPASSPLIKDYMEVVTRHIKDSDPELYYRIADMEKPTHEKKADYAIAQLVNKGMDGRAARQAIEDPMEWDDVREDVELGLRRFVDEEVFGRRTKDRFPGLKPMPDLPKGPEMARRKKEDPTQQGMLEGIKRAFGKGVPGEEWGPRSEHATGEQVGVVEQQPEQKIWPQEIDWQEKSEAKDKQSLPYRPITPSEAKNPAELKKFLTEDARKEGSELPVSYTRRATVLFDKTDGSVHIVSTYPGDGTVRMVDPSLAGAERPNKPVEELLHRYQPIASVLFRDARQNFHQKFLTMGAYNKFFGDIAKEGAREHFTGLAGIPGAEGQTLRGPTLTGVKESGYTGIGREAGAPEQAVFNKPKSEREPTMARPSEEELQAVSDYFGDNPPSDFEWFDKQFHRLAATGSRQMISAVRKMMRLEMQTHRGMSPGEALENVLNQLYENLTNTETRKGFVTRTLAQIRARAPEEIPPRGEPRKTGARELTKLDFPGPRQPPAGTGKPLTEGVEVKPTEMLSPAEREEVNRQVRMQTVEGSPTAPMSPTIYRQLANRQVPKERYTVTGAKSKLDDIFKLEDVDPDEVDEVIKEMEEEESKRKNPDLTGFTERELMSEKPERQLSEQSDPETLTKYVKEKPGRTKEGKTGEQIALERAEASRQQSKLDLGQRADAPKEDYVFEQHLEQKQLRDMARRLSDPNTTGDAKLKIRDEMFRRINDYYHKYGTMPDTNPKGPAMLRRVSTAVDDLKEFLEKTGRNISAAGDLSDQLYRLKTSEKADYDLALPVIKSALKLIPEADRPKLMKYADEMQVLKRSGVKLTDGQQMIYDTFLKPLMDDNQKMYKALMRAGIPVGESTYLGRLVQDTHSLYSRLWRGTKQRITEGSLLGQGASFFKRRVFKALEGPNGERKLIALVGDGKNTRVLGYEKGKATMMGKMPPESLEPRKMTPQQERTQRIVEARRLRELDALDKEEFALLKEKDKLSKDPNADPARVKGVDDRLSSINNDYIDIANKYPNPLFDIPRMWKDKDGNVWKFTDATIGEIESNTNTRYYQEPMSAILTQNLKLKQIYRANQFLENLKGSEEFKRISRSVNERNVPEDWRTVDLPQFRGLRIEPRTADVLDLFAQESKGPSLPMKYVTRLTNFLRNSLFVWNPFVHEPNLLMHWFTARGLDWAKPVGYERMFKSGVAALQDVMTRSKFRDEALRAGAPLLRGMGNINTEILNLLRKELDPNPTLATKVARALGYVNPLRMIRAFGDSLTWGTNEVLTLQLIRETMDRTGLGLHDAIAEVGKHMPNYRIPPRVLNSRLLSHVMRNPLLTLWGHYHYGALRSYGEMGKEIFSPNSTMEQRAEGLGRVATIGLLMAVAYPTIDDIVNKVLKTKGLKTRRAGSATVPSNIIDMLQGKKTPEAALQSVLTPSPVTQSAFELGFNRNLRTGLPVYERRLGTQTLKDLGSFAASKVSPIEEGQKVFGGKKSGLEFGLGLAGIARTRADSAMSQFGRMADNWMRTNPDESIRDQYKRRTQDVFQESDYQNLRGAIIREDNRAAEMAMNKLLRTRKPTEIAQRIQQWKDSPFTGTRKTDRALIEQMTPQELDLWYQAAQERLDISDAMMNVLIDAAAKAQ